MTGNPRGGPAVVAARLDALDAAVDITTREAQRLLQGAGGGVRRKTLAAAVLYRSPFIVDAAVSVALRRLAVATGDYYQTRRAWEDAAGSGLLTPYGPHYERRYRLAWRNLLEAVARAADELEGIPGSGVVAP